MRAGPFTLDLPLRSQRAGLNFHREEIPQIARSTISKSLTHNHKDRSSANKCLYQSCTKYNSSFIPICIQRWKISGFYLRRLINK